MPNAYEEQILRWCRDKDPPDADSVYEVFCEPSGLFRLDEGPVWDFKATWPFSLSDDYFGAVARAVCAFSNSRGGVLVFGVHDKLRTGGHNKVTINFDRFTQAIKQLVGATIQLFVRSYENAKCGDVTVLFISSRTQGIRPYKFLRSVGRYPANTIWVRSGHEVVEASPVNFSMLFCRSLKTQYDSVPPVLDGSLPPSPATLKRFIGRIKVMEDLFDWLQNSDEPRVYLYGKGGSGKSTIAFEFAQLLQIFGSDLTVHNRDNIDSVIYLSAKEQSLQTTGIPSIISVDPDFQNESELYKKILYYGRWILDEVKIQSLDLNSLREEVKSFFDYVSVVLLIDDIDTLTTKGIDPGADYIYRVLCRAKRVSKVVYTLRNAPSQSMSNSIEVPGLDGGDYIDFVKECVQEFKVSEPTKEFRDGILASVSERRPLVIESVIALVRTAGSYKRAAELFDQHAGEQIRDYVFSREWEALSPAGAARPLLAALSDLNQPVTFSQLETVLRVAPSRLQDAIGEVREMFLKVDQVGEEALFSLAPLTRKFVAEEKDTIQVYNVIRERIKAFKRTSYISNPKVAEEVTRIERIIPPRFAGHSADTAAEAWRIVNRTSLPPVVTENPLFRSLYGYAAASCSPPRLTEARDAFGYSLQMKFEPDLRYLLAWFTAERNSGIFDGWCEKIVDIVISGKSYSENDKIMMISRKASSIYASGRYKLTTDYVDGIRCIRESLGLHLKAFRLNCLAGSTFADSSESFGRNTTFTLFNALRDFPWEQVDVIRSLCESKDIYLDPIEDAVREFATITLPLLRVDDIANRVRQRLKGLPDLLSRNELWLSTGAKTRVLEIIRHAEKTLTDRLKK
jgi:Putative DNA-binding domain